MDETNWSFQRWIDYVKIVTTEHKQMHEQMVGGRKGGRDTGREWER